MCGSDELSLCVFCVRLDGNSKQNDLPNEETMEGAGSEEEEGSGEGGGNEKGNSSKDKKGNRNQNSSNL